MRKSRFTEAQTIGIIKEQESGMPTAKVCRIWRKIHLGIDEETLEVRAVEVTTSNVGDAPMLPEMLDQIPPDQDIGSVTADGACDTRKCHEAIAKREAHTIIPPRKNAKPWKPTSAGAIARNEAVQAS